MVSTANGDPTPLEFTNLKAEFYGFDVAYGVDLPFDLKLGGILSWVRGKRRDINDDLYRVAPLRGRSTLSYHRESWSVSIEGVYAARQNHVSKTNSETKTGGYGIANLFGRWEVSKGIASELRTNEAPRRPIRSSSQPIKQPMGEDWWDCPPRWAEEREVEWGYRSIAIASWTKIIASLAIA
jgi:iron complex outermembrane receptor protein